MRITHRFSGALLVAFVLVGPCARAALDRNNDLLSDVWAQRFSAPTGSAALDNDGDGFTNQQESILGTNPFDRASALHQTLVARADGSLDLSWPTRAAKRYHVETSPDLVVWTRVTTFTGTDATLDASLPADGAPRRFTRVLAEEIDTDADGLTDWEERTAGTNPARMFSEGLGNSSTNVAARITDLERVREALSATNNTVTVFAVDPAMAENWPDPGVIVVRRTGRLDSVTVNLTLGGTATNGFDYATPPALSVTIPYGADEATSHWPRSPTRSPKATKPSSSPSPPARATPSAPTPQPPSPSPRPPMVAWRKKPPPAFSPKPPSARPPPSSPAFAI